jgi:hypothetical protein
MFDYPILYCISVDGQPGIVINNFFLNKIFHLNYIFYFEFRYLFCGLNITIYRMENQVDKYTVLLTLACIVGSVLGVAYFLLP